ncbi:restriction endonuclease subunit S [Chromobacterium vaccinii]|uniref:restriction endonuclease subunit S n=1 Tax=Chromobacterium vaccinii TaxID=1108595 RepID=UPI003458F09F
MSRHKAYPEYKDSEIEWLGAIPVAWNVVSLKRVGEIFNGATPKSDREDYWDGDISWITPADLGKDKSRHISEGARSITTLGYLSCGTKLIAKGTIILSSRAPIGTLGIAERELCTNQGCKSITTGEKLHNDFLYYLFRCSTKWLNLLGRGTTFLELSTDELAAYKVCTPPIDEQWKIVDFLDHEIAKIDTLIEKQQALIALLKEKRQAVISHAVTKGLNPDVSMRDSGVEWLGMVPAHWIVRRLKHTAALQSGMPKGKDLADRHTISVPMLRVANVQDGYVDLSDVHQINIEPTDLDRYTLKNGDVLMNEGGDNDKLGRGAVWDGSIQPCIHQNHVFAIRPQEIEPEWLDLVTRADYAKFHFFRVAKQSTNLASISSSNIKETPLLIPPEVERRNIMKFVESKLSKFDLLEMQANKQIELFQERRTALISAAVTGKIDVRDWQPPEAAA